MVRLTFFVDSNILIFSAIEEYPEFKIANKKLAEIGKKGKIAINNIIVSETFHKISILKNLVAAKKKTKDILKSDFVAYIPIEKSTVVKAIELSAKYRVRINDSIIAQHVLDSKADGILTDNVKDFSKIKRLNVISLR